jgi:hypothetical protein
MSKKYKCEKHGLVEGLELEFDVDDWKKGQVICSKRMMAQLLKHLKPLKEAKLSNFRSAFSGENYV